MREFSAEEKAVQSALSGADLYHFSRWMFLRRKGFQWRRARHHRLICDALMRVYRGECKRLVINIPPRYSKTELAVVNFIAWAMGKNPDSEFIHASYSATLAVNNSVQIRAMMQHEAYRDIFPGVGLATEAAHYWKTTAGGVMYAAGAGGTITGFGAGKHRDGFGGCFPAGTRVWTENGLLPIDRIVRERMRVRVWSFDYAGRMVLKPVLAWHENPPNKIVRVVLDDGESVECTPDHRFWTENRGWVRADSLRVDDRLPRVCGGVQGLDDIGIDANSAGGGLNSLAVLAPGPVGAIGKGKIGLVPREDRARVGGGAALAGNIPAARDRGPGVTAPDLVDHGSGDTMLCGNVARPRPGSVVDFQGLSVGQDGARVNLGLAESSVRLAVTDVAGPAVVPQIGQPVIGGVAVSVADVGPIGARSNECQHDKRVHAGVLDARLARQTDAQVTAGFTRGLEQLPGLQVTAAAASVGDVPVLAANPSRVANGVKPFVSGHREPALVEFVRHDECTFCLTVEDHHNFTVECGLVVKNCIILDDPHKADEARSEVMRQNVIDWFQNTLESRKNSPDTPIIVIMQRLHEDDLAGWLLRGGNGEEWESLILPVWNEDGTPLWPEKHDAEALARMESAAPYVFAGQYRQRPAPPEGGIIKPDQIKVVDAIPAGRIEWVRGWDFASTTTGDWTAGAKIGRMSDGRYIIADMVRLRAGPDERDAALRNTAERDGLDVKISMPQDPGQAGKTQALYLTRSLSGFRVSTSPESGDKITRAEPLAAQTNVGNVLMIKAAWNDALINEMRMFPNGSHDDQVDALSRAFGEVMVVRRSWFG